MGGCCAKRKSRYRGTAEQWSPATSASLTDPNAFEHSVQEAAVPSSPKIPRKLLSSAATQGGVPRGTSTRSVPTVSALPESPTQRSSPLPSPAAETSRPSLKAATSKPSGQSTEAKDSEPSRQSLNAATSATSDLTGNDDLCESARLAIKPNSSDQSRKSNTREAISESDSSILTEDGDSLPSRSDSSTEEMEELVQASPPQPPKREPSKQKERPPEKLQEPTETLPKKPQEQKETPPPKPQKQEAPSHQPRKETETPEPPKPPKKMETAAKPEPAKTTPVSTSRSESMSTLTSTSTGDLSSASNTELSSSSAATLTPVSAAQAGAKEKSKEPPVEWGRVMKTEPWGDTSHTSCTEYRIRIPLSLVEFERARIHAICEGSKKVTSGGSGVEVLRTEPFGPTTANNVSHLPTFGLPGNSGIYTEKIYRVHHLMPGPIRSFFSEDFMTMEERAWNAFPLSKTVITNRRWLPQDFLMQLYTLYVDGDRADLDNALKLPPELLKIRKIMPIDITDDEQAGGPKAYKADEDPKRLRTWDGRGPFPTGWEKGYKGPQLVAYKVVTARLRFFMVEERLRAWGLDKAYPSVFARIYRLSLCTYDEWSRRSVCELRQREATTWRELRVIQETTVTKASSSIALEA